MTIESKARLKMLIARTPAEAIRQGDHNLTYHFCNNVPKRDLVLVRQEARFIARRIDSQPYGHQFTPIIDLGSCTDYFYSDKEGYLEVEHAIQPRNGVSIGIRNIKRISESEMEKILEELER